LTRQLVLRVRLEPAADAHIQPFGGYAEDGKIHVRGRPSLQRTQPIVEQADRPVVGVEIELEADAEENVPGVTVVRHARIAERADEDGIELVPQPGIPVAWNRLAGLQVV